MDILLKFNILPGRISETNKDIWLKFYFVLHSGPIYCNSTI